MTEKENIPQRIRRLAVPLGGSFIIDDFKQLLIKRQSPACHIDGILERLRIGRNAQVGELYRLSNAFVTYRSAPLIGFYEGGSINRYVIRRSGSVREVIDAKRIAIIKSVADSLQGVIKTECVKCILGVDDEFQITAADFLIGIHVLVFP